MREIALNMTNVDVEKTKYSTKVSELFALKKVFESIKNPTINSTDKLTISKVDNCILNLHKSGEGVKKKSKKNKVKKSKTKKNKVKKSNTKKTKVKKSKTKKTKVKKSNTKKL
jgi:hypothetical protein